MSPRLALSKADSIHALQLGSILSMQEEEYGINMMDAMTPLDDSEIHNLMSDGCTENEAKLIIFQRRYVSSGKGDFFDDDFTVLDEDSTKSVNPGKGDPSLISFHFNLILADVFLLSHIPRDLSNA
jgi:hypothetical protein